MSYLKTLTADDSEKLVPEVLCFLVFGFFFKEISHAPILIKCLLFKIKTELGLRRDCGLRYNFYY